MLLTTVLPVLFKYCYKYCYSDSRKLWAVMNNITVWLCKVHLNWFFCKNISLVLVISCFNKYIQYLRGVKELLFFWKPKASSTICKLSFLKLYTTANNIRYEYLKSYKNKFIISGGGGLKCYWSFLVSIRTKLYLPISTKGANNSHLNSFNTKAYGVGSPGTKMWQCETS
jgi:hypothetical protein